MEGMTSKKCKQVCFVRKSDSSRTDEFRLVKFVMFVREFIQHHRQPPGVALGAFSPTAVIYSFIISIPLFSLHFKIIQKIFLKTLINKNPKE